jgi:hypothetical protein
MGCSPPHATIDLEFSTFISHRDYQNPEYLENSNFVVLDG